MAKAAKKVIKKITVIEYTAAKKKSTEKTTKPAKKRVHHRRCQAKLLDGSQCTNDVADGNYKFCNVNHPLK
jgi:hypothetical protein